MPVSSTAAAKEFIAVLLVVLLTLGPAGCRRRVAAPQVPLTPAVFQPLEADLRKSYLELFQASPTLEYSPTQIARMGAYLKGADDYCVGRFKQRSSTYESDLRTAQGDLKNTHLTSAQRHDLHCRIQNLRALKSQTDVLARHAIPIAYQNKEAKLELIEKWPADLKQIRQDLADGAYRKRRWGDVQDIGFRAIASGQKDDIKTGEDAIRQMKLTGLMPHALENKAVTDYVDTVAQKIARHSDLQVPLKVTVLNSKEINAFALPGGFLFVERGLLEAADDEAELAGVIGHEMAHMVARHGHQLMNRAEMASLLYQAAEVAAVVLTGGAATIGTYYALQYGFYGLGLALNLELLGVSRDFELQADQLGIQYAWNSGYNPDGFIRFFDKMATQEGYVNGVGWFHDHPPFYERMVDAEREIDFLPKKPGLVLQTSEFLAMKKALTKVMAQARQEEKNRPSLLAPEQGCAAPAKSEYQPGQPIETICSMPQPSRASAR